MGLMTLFSQYLDSYNIPVCVRKDGAWKKSSYPLFRSFPVILSVVLAWVFCGILTATDAIPDDPNHWSYRARTDVKAEALHSSPWFLFPYPFQWGLPTVSLPGFVAMTSAVLATVVKSTGDYYACARLSGAPMPPTHAVNRGILMEGLGCMLAGVFGTGTGLTAYSQNIGAIGITKVGSRRVIFYSAVIMLLLGILGKISALFVSLPEPVIGGIFTLLFGVIASVGVSNLQYVDMNSSRNLFIFGASVMMGLMLPGWLSQHPGAVNTGFVLLDQTVTTLAKTGMFVSGILAFILDNTIRGTPEQRGLTKWRPVRPASGDDDSESVPGSATYDLPWITPAVKRNLWTRYVPFCSTFTGFGRLRRTTKTRSQSSENADQDCNRQGESNC